MKHCLTFYCRIFSMTYICDIWDLKTKRKSNQYWRDPQSAVPLSVHPIHITSQTPLSVFTHITTTPNMNGWTEAVEPTQSHIRTFNVKPKIWVSSHTSSHNFHSYTFIYPLWSHIRTLSCIHLKFLHVLARVACYFSSTIPTFLRPYCHSHEDRGLLGYQTKDYQCEIPLITILNDITSKVFQIIFSSYFFMFLILISKFKVITEPK